MTNNQYFLGCMLAAITLVLNLPFGLLRVKTKKYSLLWFLYIHLPVPLIVFLHHRIGLSSLATPVIILAAVLGQVLGGRVRWPRSQ